MTKEELISLNRRQQNSRDILEPTIDEQPVYDFLTDKTYSREEYNTMNRLSRKAAERIYEAAEASENITCPGIEIMRAIIWRTLFGVE